ncbi:MAG: hypothetical protein Q9207_002623 [Kuettlingeria erythrocarpa]
MPLLRKQKLCKDEATFIKGKPQEEVRYWPCEYQGGHIAAEHQKFRLYPVGHITEYCKHVPYRSEKKKILSRTGREGFHVFQYTFQMPLDEKKHTVMWDYNTGLVRITPFFKALNYPKTTPARMLGKNPGLKEICHSITGGSLAAQGMSTLLDSTGHRLTKAGYWMPFEAARAVTATFCYRIRYVLTPIFGLDFPAQCIPVGAPGYDSMHISPKIIRQCTEPAMNCRNMALEPKARSRPETPVSASVAAWTPANARSRALQPVESESGWGTDTDTNTDNSDAYFCSPKKRARSGFKSLVAPRSAAEPRRYQNCYAPSSTPSSYGDESELSDDCKKRKRNNNNNNRNRLPRSSCTNEDDESDGFSSEASRSCLTTAKKRKASSTTPVMSAETAAKRLLDLCIHDSLLKGPETRKRRASA